MNKLRKRILITFIALVFMFGCGAAIWSYRNAIAEDAPDVLTESVDMATRPAGFTNIDYIIENANDATLTPDPNTGYDESEYHIVEISSGNLSLLRLFSVAAGATTDTTASFSNVVLTLNKSSAQTKDMIPDKIKYTGFSTSSIQADPSAASEAIRQADLVYVSIDKNNVYDSDNGNDIPAEVKTALSSYSVKNKKPIIIDSPTKTKEDIDGSISTFNTLGKILFEEGSSRNSFFWKKTVYDSTNDEYTIDNANGTFDPAYYFDRSHGSNFMVMNGSTLQTNWVNGFEEVGGKYYKVLNGTEEVRVAKILSITTDNNTPMADALKEGQTPVSITTLKDGKTLEELTVVDGEGNTVNDVDANGRQAYAAQDASSEDNFEAIDVYDVSSLHLDNAYKTYFAHPDYVKFETLVYDKDTVELSNDYLSQFDMIILEDSCNAKLISDGTDTSTTPVKNDFQLFVNLLRANRHIVYSPLLIPDGSNNGRIVYNAIQFMDLYDELVDNTDKKKYDWVLVCCEREMNQYASTEATKDTEAPIVYIINKGAYRPSGSGTDSTNLFTVLEIQPSYPVDMNLARKLKELNIYTLGGSQGEGSNTWGNVDINNYSYFMDTLNVTSDSLDEISYDGTTSVSAMKNIDGSYTNAGLAILNRKTGVKDYYAWELSPAKVLHAIKQTNEFKDYTLDKIQVVHMSSTEFQSSRASLLDNYDLIYIGGNNSGIKDLDYFRANPNGKDSSGSSNIGAKNATYYNMYYHNGDLFEYPATTYVGYVPNGYGILAGNDLTYDKYDELKKYVEAGMPVVISFPLTYAYDNMASDRSSGKEYQQHLIDPDSNMTKFLDYCDTTTATNVLWNFDPNDTVRIANENNAYSEKAYSGFVTVFGGNETEDYLGNSYTAGALNNEKQLSALIESSMFRPKFKMTRFPTVYDGTNYVTKKNSALSGRLLNYEFDMISSSDDVTFSLYIDDNVDSKFTEDELVVSGIPASTSKFTYTVADDYSGALYLQVTATYEEKNSAGEKTGRTSKTSWREVCKISPNDGMKDKINVLQILPYGAHGKNGSFTTQNLFFCTECQTSGRILDANRYSKNFKYTEDTLRGKWDPDGFGDSNPPGLAAPTVQTGIENRSKQAAVKVQSSDSNFKYNGNNLGVHQHVFGILDYNSALPGLNNAYGADDVADNLADEITDDYEFQTSIYDTREFEAICQRIYDTYNASGVNIENLRSAYNNQASKYEHFFREMQIIIEDGVKYVPSKILSLREEVAKTNLTDTRKRQINADLKTVYDAYSITWSYSIDTSNPADVYSTLLTRLGITAADVTKFNDTLEKYDMSYQNHLEFETEMIALGSTLPALSGYAHAQSDLDDEVMQMLSHVGATVTKNENPTKKLSDRLKDGDLTYSTSTRFINGFDWNKAHLKDNAQKYEYQVKEFVYWMVHHNYYD